MANLKGKRGIEPKLSRRYRSAKGKAGSRRPHHSSERTHKYKVFRKGLRKRSFRFEIAILSCKMSHHRVTLTRTFKTKFPPLTGATPQQEIFSRSPALLSISQKRQPPLPSHRDTAQTIQPANQYSPPPRGSCHLPVTGGVALKSSEYPKVKFSRSFPSPWGDARGVLVPGGHRPGPTVAEAETGAGRSPPESCALMEGGFPPRKGGFPRGPTAPLGKEK